MSNDTTLGEWKFLGQAVGDSSLAQAERAVVELGIIFRLLDDRYLVPDYLKDKKTIIFGSIAGGTEDGQLLSVREMSNKIVHAHHFQWNTKNFKAPGLICVSNEPDRWQSAEINILKMAILCSQLMR